MTPALFALAAAAFGVGTTEFVVMGLLPGLADDLGVTLPDAGLIITAYAAGVVVGAPIAAVVTNGMGRKAALLGLIGLFILGNIACALAPGYAWLVGARILTAFCHAAFFGIAALVAADLVPPERRGRAVALVFIGLTVANILGVPGGTVLGNAFGWRSTFVAVVAIGVVAFGLVALLVPRGLPRRRADLGAEFRAVLRPEVLSAMLLTVLTSASLFAVFSFIAPILGEVTRLDGNAIAIALVLFGIGMTAGGLVGGRLADWRLDATLGLASVAVVAAMVAFALLTAWAAPTYALLFVWGAAIFALAPGLQMRVIRAAQGAPTLASTLNQAAFNIGNAAGAALGAGSLAAGISLVHLPWVGVGLAVVAAVLAGAPFVMRRAHDTVAIVARRDLFDPPFGRA